MGNLAGFKYRQIVKRLKKLGFEFNRQAAGPHEIWFNPETDKYTTIPNHPGDMPEGTLKAILNQAGISTDQFLNAYIDNAPMSGAYGVFAAILCPVRALPGSATGNFKYSAPLNLRDQIRASPFA
ncbi:YcfA-like protein [bacterium BMS3Bbin13]|nr:YcfA-like protein [bacterium BMS3Bbin13]